MTDTKKYHVRLTPQFYPTDPNGCSLNVEVYDEYDFLRTPYRNSGHLLFRFRLERISVHNNYYDSNDEKEEISLLDVLDDRLHYTMFIKNDFHLPRIQMNALMRKIYKIIEIFCNDHSELEPSLSHDLFITYKQLENLNKRVQDMVELHHVEINENEFQQIEIIC